MATIEIRDLLDNETGKTVFPRTHVDAVIGLKDSSFFEAVSDGNGSFSVKLKSEYTGLWADGWIAAGGIGSGSGGGGGLIQTVYTWSDIQEMSNAPEDDMHPRSTQRPSMRYTRCSRQEVLMAADI